MIEQYSLSKLPTPNTWLLNALVSFPLSEIILFCLCISCTSPKVYIYVCTLSLAVCNSPESEGWRDSAEVLEVVSWSDPVRAQE